MNFDEIYGLVLASVFAVLIGWHLAAEISRARALLFGTTRLRKLVLQTLIFTRQPGAEDVSIGTAIAVLIWIGFNVAACALNIASKQQLASRLSAIAILNAVPLMTGGRSSLLASNVLGLSPPRQSAVHRWLGRICLVEAAAHACIRLSLQGWAFTATNIIVTRTSSYRLWPCANSFCR